MRLGGLRYIGLDEYRRAACARISAMQQLAAGGVDAPTTEALSCVNSIAVPWPMPEATPVTVLTCP